MLRQKELRKQERDPERSCYHRPVSDEQPIFIFIPSLFDAVANKLSLSLGILILPPLEDIARTRIPRIDQDDEYTTDMYITSVHIRYTA